MALGAVYRAVRWLRMWGHVSCRRRGMRRVARLAGHIALRTQTALCRAVWQSLEDRRQRAAVARRLLCCLRERAHLRLRARWWCEWVAFFLHLRDLHRKAAALASRRNRGLGGLVLSQLGGILLERRGLRWCGTVISKNHRSVLMRCVVRGWLALCAWQRACRRSFEKIRAKNHRSVLMYCMARRWLVLCAWQRACRRSFEKIIARKLLRWLQDWNRVRRRLSSGRRLCCRQQGAWETRRQAFIFERWSTLSRERRRMAVAGGRCVVRKQLRRVAGEWRSFVDWRSRVRPLLGQPGAIDSCMISSVSDGGRRSRRAASFGNGDGRQLGGIESGRHANKLFERGARTDVASLWRLRGSEGRVLSKGAALADGLILSLCRVAWRRRRRLLLWALCRMYAGEGR